MINMMDQDTRTERKQVFDTQLSRRRNRLFSSLSSNIVFGIFLQNATFRMQHFNVNLQFRFKTEAIFKGNYPQLSP